MTLPPEPPERLGPRRWWPAAIVGLTTLVGLAWLVLQGVRSKEDCSSVVGSVEVDGGLYRPCELVGYLQAAIAAALITLVMTAVVRDGRIRAGIAGVGALVTLGIGLAGLGTLSL